MSTPFLADFFLRPAPTSCDHQLSGCENKKHGCHSFYIQWKMHYFKIGIALKCVLMTFLLRNMDFIFIILAQWMYIVFSLLVFTKIIASFSRILWGCHVWYCCYRCCYVAMGVTIDSATAKTTACTLFVSFFWLCSYLGCYFYSFM